MTNSISTGLMPRRSENNSTLIGRKPRLGERLKGESKSIVVTVGKDHQTTKKVKG